MRLPFIILASAIITIGAVGVALATTHDTRTGDSGGPQATTGGPLPVLPAATPAATPGPAELMEEGADPSGQPQRSRADDCPDDCVCPREPKSSAHPAQGPAKAVDDDRDGDGGDCGEAD